MNGRETAKSGLTIDWLKKKMKKEQQKRNKQHWIYEATDRELDGRPRRGIFVVVYIPLRASFSWCRGHHLEMEPVPQSGSTHSPFPPKIKTQATRDLRKKGDDRKAGSSSSFEVQVPVELQLPVSGPRSGKTNIIEVETTRNKRTRILFQVTGVWSTNRVMTVFSL